MVSFLILPDQICSVSACTKADIGCFLSRQNVYKMSNEGTAGERRICKDRNCKGATTVYPCSLHIWISKASKCSDTPQNTHFLWMAWLTSHPCSLATSPLIYKLLFLCLSSFSYVTHSYVQYFLAFSFIQIPHSSSSFFLSPPCLCQLLSFSLTTLYSTTPRPALSISDQEMTLAPN